MDPSNTAPAPLSPAEEAEIAEYERIVAFSEQVMAGTHPRVKIPTHLLQAQQASIPSAAASTAPAAVPPVGPVRPTPVVNTAHDYYKDLGIHPSTPLASIDRAYQAKMELYGPDAPAAQRKYASSNPNVVRAVKADCFKATRAYNILSDPEIRQEYDRARAAVAGAGTAAAAALEPRSNPIARGGYGRGRGGRGRGRRGASHG